MPSFNRTIPTVAAALAVVLVVAPGGSQSRGASSSKTVDVYPIDGTTTVSPGTQISFRGATRLKNFSVTGSSTGAHGGRFLGHSDGQGFSFVPYRGFRENELVTVRSSTRLTGATAAGAVRFRILTRPNAADLARAIGKVSPDPEGSAAGVQSFHSREDLRPPGLKVITRTAAASNDDIFLAAKSGPGQDGPTIRNAQGRLIWFRRVKPPLSPYDFRAQTYRGRPVLTWWQGRILAGKGRGYGVMLDSSYRPIKHITAGNGYHMDQHEFELTPRGTAFINVYEPVTYSLEPAGGPRRATVWDSIVQEIDIKTGLVLFEWHSLAHVSVRLGTFPLRPGLPYDPFHVNSVSEDANGNLLLSARNTNALFFIRRHDGHVLSRIGGKKSDFKLGPGAPLIGQHQAVLQHDGTITAFDNGGSTQFPTVPDRESRGVQIRLDEGAGTDTLVHEYKHPGSHLFSRSQGSMQVLPSGNVFLSWGGSNSYLTELTPDGRTVFESHILPGRNDTYRVYRLPWGGARPTDRPAVVASTGGSGTTVYVSWNGATDVAHWEVLAGSDRKALRPVATVGWAEFETRIALPGASPKYVAVRALRGDGGVLGTSATIAPKAGR